MSEPGSVDIATRILGERAQLNAPLGALTTYRVGGNATVMVHPRQESDLELVAKASGASGLAVVVVGNGSNLLVSDAGFDGIAVMMGAGFDEIDIDGTTVHAGGAVSLPVLARRTVAAGLCGFEWAVGVPGTVGGAVRMNAGGHGAAMANTLLSARIVDLHGNRSGDIPFGELGLQYRSSNVTSSQVVVKATLALAAGDAMYSQERLSEIVRWRREHQPGGQNAGSCFANPEGDYAGRLIEAGGLKGLRIGSACVHDKHANFIQADEGGKAQDVFELMRKVQELVRQQTGVSLRSEVRLLGNFAEPDSTADVPQ